MADTAPVTDSGFVDLFVAFGNELRADGIAVGSGDVVTYCEAMAALDPTDLVDLYWAGRTTLVVRREQIPTYDRAFRRFFLDEHDGLPEPLRAAITPAAHANAVLEIPATEPGARRRCRRSAGAPRPHGIRRRALPHQVVRRVHPG